MAMVWCLRHIWCKCWVKESGREQGVSGVQSGYPWLTLSRLRSSAIRQAFLGLLQSSVITLGGKRTPPRWEWGWGDQDLFSHPGWASEDHGVNPMLDICLPLRSSLCPADSCFEGWPPTMSSSRSPALWLPLGLVSGRTCRRKERSHFPFWQWLFSSTRGLGSCHVAPLLHSNCNDNTVSNKSFLPHLLWAPGETFSCVRRRVAVEIVTISYWLISDVLLTQLCPTLCDPMDCSPPGSSVHRILQARILKWVAIPFSQGSSQPKDQTRVSCIAGRFFIVWVTKEALISNSLSLNFLSHPYFMFSLSWLWVIYASLFCLPPFDS